MGSIIALSAGHSYYVEIDVDPDTENNPGPRGDYYIHVKFLDKCDTTNFIDSKDAGDGYERATDTDNDVGGDTIPGSDYDSSDTGYDTGDSASGSVWCRITNNGNPQAAILRSYIGLSSTKTNVRMRGQTSQASSISKGDMYWNDHQDETDLGNEDFDNTQWFGGTNAVTLSGLSVDTADLDITNTGILLLVLVGAVSVGFLRHRQRSLL